MPNRSTAAKKSVLLIAVAAVLLVAVVAATLLFLFSPKGRARPVELKGLEEYTIVYKTGIGSEIFRAIRSLMQRIEDVSGVTLDYGEDYTRAGESVPTDTKEILIGDTNREESASYNLDINDFGIWYENGRLVIRGGSDEALIRAIEYFTEEYVTEEGVMRPRSRVLSLEEYPYGEMLLNGVDIYEYTIVRDARSEAIATILRDAIAEATGACLKIVGHRAEVTNGCEILVGSFSSEERQSPEVADGTWTIATSGTRVYLTGAGEDGSYDAVLAFCAELGGSGRSLKLDYGTPAVGKVDPTVLFSLNLPDSLPSLESEVGLTMTTDNVLARFLATKAELPDEVSTVERVSLDDYPASLRRQIFVSPTGDDGAEGTKEAPLATLEEALLRMENRAGGVIWMMGGHYYTDKEIAVKREHSGLRLSPLFIKAWEDEEVVLSSNRGLSSEYELWRPISANANSDVYDRFPVYARGHIIYTTLEEQGVDVSAFSEIGTKGPPSLYVGGELYTLARYPNSNEPLDLLYFTETYDTGTVTQRDGSNLYWGWYERAQQWRFDPLANVGWEIRIPDDPMVEEILSWVNTGDIWFYGSVFEGWEHGYFNLALTDADEIAGGGQNWSHPSPDDPSVPLLGKLKDDGGYALKSMRYSPHGCKHSTNSPAGRNTFYLFNAVEALDAPGEWFLDRDTGVLYLYPTDAEEFHGSAVEVSGTKEFTVLSLTKAENVVLDGLTVDGSMSSGIYISDSHGVVAQDITVRNTRSANLVVAGQTTDTAVIYSDFSASSSMLVSLALSSSTQKLTPTNVIVQNCVFHDPKPTVQIAVSLGGCRTVVSHNYFHNTTLQTVSASECIIEYNRFEGGSADVTDGGMIYMTGPSSRGNHIRYNLLHMFRATHNAVYNDGMSSGNYAYGNVISFLGSQSNLNNGWYSSTGVGNVCYGNVMVLRNPQQVREAGSSAGNEGDVVLHGDQNDQVNQSGLFYYHFGEQYSSGTAGLYYFVDMNGNPITRDSGSQLAAAQSLAGHWWVGQKTGEVELYYETSSAEAWALRDPVYMNHLLGTQLILDAYADTAALPEGEQYHPRYFYVPWYLSGKTYTATVPAGTEILIPAYQYKGTDGKLVDVPAETRVVDDTGRITLTYEEIAAMERFRRQPSVSVIENNVLLGGRATYGLDGRYTTTSDPSMIITNSAATYFGYNETASIKDNYFNYLPDEVLEDPKAYEYLIKDSAREAIQAVLSEDGYACADRLKDWDSGVTYSYDYSIWW